MRKKGGLKGTRQHRQVVVDGGQKVALCEGEDTITRGMVKKKRNATRFSLFLGTCRHKHARTDTNMPSTQLRTHKRKKTHTKPAPSCPPLRGEASMRREQPGWHPNRRLHVCSRRGHHQSQCCSQRKTNKRRQPTWSRAPGPCSAAPLPFQRARAPPHGAGQLAPHLRQMDEVLPQPVEREGEGERGRAVRAKKKEKSKTHWRRGTAGSSTGTRWSAEHPRPTGRSWPAAWCEQQARMGTHTYTRTHTTHTHTKHTQQTHRTNTHTHK